MNLKVFAAVSLALFFASAQVAAAQETPARDIYQRIADAERVPLENRDAAALVQLGRDYRKVGRPKDADVQANEALKKAPESADALLLLGDLQLQRREYSKALATFSRVEQLRPGSAAAQQRRSEALSGMGLHREAEAAHGLYQSRSGRVRAASLTP